VPICVLAIVALQRCGAGGRTQASTGRRRGGSPCACLRTAGQPHKLGRPGSNRAEAGALSEYSARGGAAAVPHPRLLEKLGNAQVSNLDDITIRHHDIALPARQARLDLNHKQQMGSQLNVPSPTACSVLDAARAACTRPQCRAYASVAPSWRGVHRGRPALLLRTGLMSRCKTRAQ